MQRRLKLKLRKRDAVACDLSDVLLQRGQIDLILRDESVVREKDNVRYHLHRSSKNVRFKGATDVRSCPERTGSSLAPKRSNSY